MEAQPSNPGRYSFDAYPSGWFRVAYSNELEAGEVLLRKYFGLELVAFREEGGAAHVLDAFCPHLGAHLGYGGVVVGDRIRCPFHHWQFDGAGVCREIPYAKRIPPAARLRSWPMVEKNGLILVYYDREGREPSFEVPDLSELTDPAWTPPDVAHWKVRARWLDMNENCVDQAHFKYIHGTLSIPPTTAEIDGHIHRAKSNFRMRVPGGESDAVLVTTDHGPGFQTVHITGLIDTLMMNTATPIDEDHTDVSFLYTVRSDGDARKAHLADAVVVDLRKQFESDRLIWENKTYWSRPVLCDGDGPVGTYRKWYAQFFS